MHMYFEATALLYILTVFTVMVLFTGIYANIYLWRKGKAPSLHHKIHFGSMIKSLILDAFLQLQLLKQSFVRWLMHFCIFWGFLGLLAHTTFLAIMSHLIPQNLSFSQYIFLGPGKIYLDVWGDLWGLILFIGIVIAIFRRYIFRAEQLDTIASDTTAILFLFFITLTGFICEAQRLAAVPFEPYMRYSFIGCPLASLVRSIPSLALDYNSIVWIHVLISFVFLAYIPFSKMFHIIVSPVEIALDASEKND
ncbi:MAG: respiratory nitrate reductase subunit gamma [Deltaproteobacteria bacterium]|nr:respiratory nitrate reductase subunit gamma [Deltaproteobacteria bacterium]